jgi:hypothetical protein
VLRFALISSAAFALLVPGASASVVAFRTPTGNIGCVYASDSGPAGGLRCDIRSRLRPLPPKPSGCDLDWGDSFYMARTGRVRLTCHGDTAILPHSRVLRYGSRWARGGFACTSRVSGLRCTNASGHGFFLSKQRSYRF